MTTDHDLLSSGRGFESLQAHQFSRAAQRQTEVALDRGRRLLSSGELVSFAFDALVHRPSVTSLDGLATTSTRFSRTPFRVGDL